MSRYIQTSAEKKAEIKEPKNLPKAGTKDYDYSNLSTVKKIPTKDGYK